MAETDPQKIVAYTQDECRAKAAAKLVEAQTYLNDSDAESTQLALAAAQLWATLALSALSPEELAERDLLARAHEIEQRGVRLTQSADADEPPEVCSAHGRAQCPSCSRSKGQLNPDGTCPECASFQVTGMHWDTCPHRDRSPLPGGEPASIPQALSHVAELADAAGKKRTAAWLRACGMAYGRGQEWPAAPKCRTLVSESDLDSDVEQLPGDILMRLRDRAQATIAQRAQTDAKVAGERWRAGTGGGIPDYPRDVRPPGGGGAAQWREG